MHRRVQIIRIPEKASTHSLLGVEVATNQPRHGCDPPYQQPLAFEVKKVWDKGVQRVDPLTDELKWDLLREMCSEVSSKIPAFHEGMLNKRTTHLLCS